MCYFRIFGRHDQSGQSMIESAVLLPFLLVIIFNTMNIGYYFFCALNLMIAPRQGAEYSIQGNASILQANPPPASAVQSIADQFITGAVRGTTGVTKYQVCSSSIGIDPNGQGTSAQIPLCIQYNGAPSSPPHPDPEAPDMVLNRVDIWYQIPPLIPGAVFNFITPPNLHRYVEMRVLN